MAGARAGDEDARGRAKVVQGEDGVGGGEEDEFRGEREAVGLGSVDERGLVRGGVVGVDEGEGA